MRNAARQQARDESGKALAKALERTRCCSRWTQMCAASSARLPPCACVGASALLTRARGARRRQQARGRVRQGVAKALETNTALQSLDLMSARRPLCSPAVRGVVARRAADASARGAARQQARARVRQGVCQGARDEHGAAVAEPHECAAPLLAPPPCGCVARRRCRRERGGAAQSTSSGTSPVGALPRRSRQHGAAVAEPFVRGALCSPRRRGAVRARRLLTRARGARRRQQARGRVRQGVCQGARDDHGAAVADPAVRGAPSARPVAVRRSVGASAPS